MAPDDLDDAARESRDRRVLKQVLVTVGTTALFFLAMAYYFFVYVYYPKAPSTALINAVALSGVITAALLVHELGHLWAMKAIYGLKVKALYLIPFVGGATIPAEEMPTKRSDVVISLMGPIWGLVLTVGGYLAYLGTGSRFWALFAFWNAILNFGNLAPVFPLDGGRVVKAILHAASAKVSIAFALLSLAAVTVAFVKLDVSGWLIGLVALMVVSDVRREIMLARQAKDRLAIVAALADCLKTEPTPEAITSEMEKRFEASDPREDETREQYELRLAALIERVKLEFRGALDRILEDCPDFMHDFIEQVTEPMHRHDFLLAMILERVACDARLEHPRLFGGGTVIATPANLVCYDSKYVTGLFKFLKGVKPMSKTEAALAILSYLLFATCLGWLFFTLLAVIKARPR